MENRRKRERRLVKLEKGRYRIQGKTLTTGHTGEIKTKEVRKQESEFRSKKLE
jgi:hypothetical protein